MNIRKFIFHFTENEYKSTKASAIHTFKSPYKSPPLTSSKKITLGKKTLEKIKEIFSRHSSVVE